MLVGWDTVVVDQGVWNLEEVMDCFVASAYHTPNLLILCANSGLGEGDMN